MVNHHEPKLIYVLKGVYNRYDSGCDGITGRQTRGIPVHDY